MQLRLCHNHHRRSDRCGVLCRAEWACRRGGCYHTSEAFDLTRYKRAAVVYRLRNRSRSIDEPLPTLTTANRGELAFITASFGERENQPPRIHSIDAPAPTICATGRINLVEPSPDHDILFRMLQPHELAGAMSISTPERPYHFIGNKTQVVRQIGQAVPRRGGRALTMALMS